MIGGTTLESIVRGPIMILIDAATLQKAQRMIAGCEACSDNAEIPFDNVLDRLTGSDPSVVRCRCFTRNRVL